MNSREKGKRGERELAQWLRERGFDARRGQQFSGSENSPDVVSSLPGIHIEVKRTERLDLYGALEQAINDATSGGERMTTKAPVVFHRRNHKQWVAILDAEDFLGFLPSNAP